MYATKAAARGSTFTRGSSLTSNILAYENQRMPSSVKSVCTRVRVKVKWKPHVWNTTLLANTIPEAETMFMRPYSMGRRLGERLAPSRRRPWCGHSFSSSERVMAMRARRPRASWRL
jgi:hypothetical protein